MLAACGGGGGSSNADSTSGGSSQDASSSSSAASSSTNSVSSSALYTTQPVVSTCTPGVVSDSEKTAVLSKLNAYRARHGLPDVSYDSSDDDAAAQAALYMVANKTLTHTPSSDGTCYTSEAYRLASTSNLYYATSSGDTRSMGSADSITAYLDDVDVSSLGHRRWILYPFFAKTTFGRADGDSASSASGVMASALRTIGNAATSVSMTNDFVAFPYGSYSTSEFSPTWYLSFSVVASKTNANANGNTYVDLDNAQISVTDGNGSSLNISSQLTNYDGYGLPNSLQWKVSGLAAGGSYTVLISDVTVNGETRSFTYDFQLTD